MKKLILLILCLFFLSACASSQMPFQGMSTANYVYKPGSVSTFQSTRTYSDGRTYTYSSKRTRTRPENAFRSLRQSAWNLERTVDSFVDIKEMLE